MASRFTDTEIWNEDWFIEMAGEYQLFVKYVFDKCDNSGVWKPMKIDFEAKTKFKVSLDLLFKKMNGGGQQRVLSLDNGRWFITGYILYQWFNKKRTFDLVLSNRLHKSLYDNLVSNNVDLKHVRGLKEVLKASMVMDSLNIISTTTSLGDKAIFKIEDCLTVALKDDRWVKATGVKDSDLWEFNEYLVKRSEYEKNPADYKQHYVNWRAKNPGNGGSASSSVKQMVM